MAVKKVSSEVAFITEPRTDFTRAAKDVEKNVTLGSWPASSIVLARKWVDPDEATIEVEMPTDFAFSIFPQKSESNVRHRARYVSVPTPVGQRRIFLIDQIDLQELDSDHVKASIKAISPEAWLSQVPSTIAGADQTFEGKPAAEPFLALLRESTVTATASHYPCTENIQGVQYRALPIITGAGSANHQQLEYYGIQDVNFDTSHSPTDGKPTAKADGDLAKPPFPAPIGDTIFNTMKKFPYQLSIKDGVEEVEYRSEFEACLVPVPSPYNDDCLWWRWLFHKRDAEPIWISRQAGTADGEATLHLTSGKTDVIAWIASSVEGSAGKAATATFPGKPRYSGPWANVETKEVSEGNNLSKADAAREAAATLAGLQAVVTIDATANAGSDSIDAMKLRPGTIAGVRFGKQSFQFPIKEVDYSFSVDTGWEIKAPVTVETNSVDYRYPSPPEPTTPPEPPEPPEPPVKPRAGLKKLYGNGSNSSIVQDLRGDWWVLTCDQNINTHEPGDPHAKRIEGLPTDAELIEVSPEDSGVTGRNVYAIFQSGEKTLWVNSGISASGTKITSINPTVTELILDSNPVSAITTTDELYLVTDSGSMYSINYDKAHNPVVEKTDKVAGIFHPTTFLPGAEDESVLVASSSYAALLGKKEFADDEIDVQLTTPLDPDETVLASPMRKTIVTSKRVVGLSSEKASAALKAHGGATGAWPDGDGGCFLGCKDGALLWLSGNESYTDTVVAMPPADGRIWRGVLSDGNKALAWGSSGLVRLEKTDEKFTATILEKAPVLTAAGLPNAACFATEAGELKIVDYTVVHAIKLGFKPKNCWSRCPLGQTIGVGKSIIYFPGYTLVAGDGNNAARITQGGSGFPFHADKIEFSSPVAEVVNPSESSFFIRLEDGSLVDYEGSNILLGSAAEGAKVLYIAEDRRTGSCLLATDHGAFRVSSTRDVLLFENGFRPKYQVKKLEGSWGDIAFVGNGVMAGPEEAHFGHPAAVVKLAELTTQAVAVDSSGDAGCFVLLEDGSICIQPSPSSAFYRVAEPPKGWAPKKLTSVNDTKVIAWAEDGNSEVINVDFNDGDNIVTVLPKLQSGLSKVKTDGNGTYALSGGKLFKLAVTEWLEDSDYTHGEGSLTDFSPGYPFCFRRGDDWLTEEDGKLQKINGLRGDLLSRALSYMSTTGCAVDFDSCKKIWSNQYSEWQEQPLEPAVVSTEQLRFIEAGGGGEVKAVKLIGGLFKINKNEVSEPADHSKPWWPDSYTLEAEDATVEASTVSKNGSTFWLGTEGITDGEDTLLLTDEQRETADWKKLASCANFSYLGHFEYGLLVPLKNGKMAWFAPGKETVDFNDLSSEGLLRIFSTGDTIEHNGYPLIVATSSSVSAAWKGEKPIESPLMVTNQPKGLKGEETTPAVWGRFGVAVNDNDVYLKAVWPVLEGLGEVKEARMDSDLYVICERGIVSPAVEWTDETISWSEPALRFEPSEYSFHALHKITVVRSQSGEILLLSNKKLVKTGVSGGIIANRQSINNGSFPITVASSSGITLLYFNGSGKLEKEFVSGSKPATAARMESINGVGWYALYYDEENGLVQATSQNATDFELYPGASIDSGLTSIGGKTTFSYFGPLIYGERGAVAVNFVDYSEKLRTSDWGSKLAALGLPTAGDTGDDSDDDSDLQSLSV